MFALRQKQTFKFTKYCLDQTKVANCNCCYSMYFLIDEVALLSIYNAYRESVCLTVFNSTNQQVSPKTVKRFKKAMSTELLVLLILLVIAVCVAYWFVRRVKSDNSSPLQLDATQPVLPSPTQTRSEIDPFLQQVVSDKAHIDETVITAIRQHKRELEQRFSGDVKHVKLKEQLSQFARMNELDVALIALWEEIEHYPTWSSQDDFDTCNKLNLIGIDGPSEGDTNSVEFMRGAQRFKVTKRIWSGKEELKADLSFFEDDNEVFAIECLVNSGNESVHHICQRISAFKKRGNWPKVLLEYYGQLKIEKDKYLDDIKYFRAGDIKSHFEE